MQKGQLQISFAMLGHVSRGLDVLPSYEYGIGVGWDLPLMSKDRINPVQHNKYHGCWCPGSLCRQVISSHDINYVE